MKIIDNTILPPGAACSDVGLDAHEAQGSHVLSEVTTRSRSDKPPMHRVTVTGVENLTPNMRRLTFEGATLKEIDAPLPAQWLMVVLRTNKHEDGPYRAYTIRRFHKGWGAMEVDFVLHGDTGPVSTWAQRVEAGAIVHVGHPRGGHKVDRDASWRVLAGDETALPAIASILEAEGGNDIPTRVIIEIPSSDDEQPLRQTPSTQICWLPRGSGHHQPGSLLAEAVSCLRLPATMGQVFLAGEANAVRIMKQVFVGHVPPVTIDAKGYWLMGQADHRDRG